MTESEIRWAALAARRHGDYPFRKGPLLFCPECQEDLRDGGLHQCQPNRYYWAGEIQFKWPPVKEFSSALMRGQVRRASSSPGWTGGGSRINEKAPGCPQDERSSRGWYWGRAF